MVSAVFHSPLAAATESIAMKKEAHSAHPASANGLKASQTSTGSAAPQTPARTPIDWRGLVLAVLPPIMGLGLLIGIWALVSVGTKNSIPSPWET